MQANLLTDFRKPTPIEEALLNRLLDADFPGKADLALLLRDLLVRSLDEDGGLELRSQIEGRASVVQRVPVEAEGKDEDGVTIHRLLHVVEDRPAELEFLERMGRPSSEFRRRQNLS